MILTAGIERTITLHSPFPSCPFSRQLSLTSQEVRQLPGSTTTEESQVVDSLLLGLDPADRDNPDEAEIDTIRLFDRWAHLTLSDSTSKFAFRILRMEGEADPFDVRDWVQAPDNLDQENT